MNKISLGYLFNLFIKRLWILILVALIFGGAAYGYCRFIAEPVYKAQASIIVTNGGITKLDSTTEENLDEEETIKTTDLDASLKLANSCVDILKTTDMYKSVAAEVANSKFTADRIKKSVTVERRSNSSLFIDITFKANTKNDAIKIANVFAEKSPEYIQNIIKSSTVNVLSPAEKALKVSPQVTYLVLVAAIIGVALAYVIALIIDLNDQSIKGEEDFVNNFDVPLLGAVPSFENALSGGYNYGKYENPKD